MPFAPPVRSEPDLILLDLYLPDVFGLDLINQIRVEGVDSDLIVISAANESHTVERAVKLGVASYLLKPFTLDDLAARLNEYQVAAPQQPASDPRPPGRGRPYLRTTRAARPTPQRNEHRDRRADLGRTQQQAHELSAQECADAIGVSRVSARRYLEHFVRKGRVQVSLRYGSRGRPERRYLLSSMSRQSTGCRADSMAILRAEHHSTRRPADQRLVSSRACVHQAARYAVVWLW